MESAMIIGPAGQVRVSGGIETIWIIEWFDIDIGRNRTSEVGFAHNYEEVLMFYRGVPVMGIRPK